jgi:hypothetical protein
MLVALYSAAFFANSPEEIHVGPAGNLSVVIGIVLACAGILIGG